MTDTDEGRTSGAAGFAMEAAPGASAAPTSPMPAPSESSSAGSGSSSSMDGRSDLLEKIKELDDTNRESTPSLLPRSPFAMNLRLDNYSPRRY